MAAYTIVTRDAVTLAFAFLCGHGFQEVVEAMAITMTSLKTLNAKRWQFFL